MFTIHVTTPLFEWGPGLDRPNGTDHPDTLNARNRLAMRYLAAGQPAKAIPLYKMTLSECERVLGPNNSNTLRSRNNLAMAYRAAGQPAKAIPLFERTLADSERVLGASHPDTKAVRANLAALTGEPEPTE